jgi:hypothetical protein
MATKGEAAAYAKDFTESLMVERVPQPQNWRAKLMNDMEPMITDKLEELNLPRFASTLEWYGGHNLINYFR